MMAYDKSDGYLYVADAYGNEVTKILGTTVLATFPVGNDPFSVKWFGASNVVYVMNYLDNTVTLGS
ncbi:MAG: YncE family protein [Nitrososphaerales archaeon]